MPDQDSLLLAGLCLLVGLVTGYLAALPRMRQLRRDTQERARELGALRDTHAELREQQAAAEARETLLRQQTGDQQALIDNARRELKNEFERLAGRIFEERGRQLGSDQREVLRSLLQPFGEQIQQFQRRVNEVHSQTVAGQAGLGEQLRQLGEINLRLNRQAEDLTEALKGDKKSTGNWGEIQLERCLQLAGLEPDLHYRTQQAFTGIDGRRYLPDAVVLLPDDKQLVIDSKVSLVDYQRAVAAETDDERRSALRAHVAALRRHISELAAKDYSALPDLESPSLVFMFLPIESAYLAALQEDRELFNDGCRVNVILASHTTLIPMLRTVANLWVAYRGNEEARAISNMAGEIYNKVVLLSQRLEDLGRGIDSTISRYNSAVTALVGKQGLQGRVERFRGIAANARGDLVEPQSRQQAVEHDRLASLSNPERGVDGSSAE